MAEFPDVDCSIKLVNYSSGKAVPSGNHFNEYAHVIVRYVVANDSHKSAGPLWVAGSLRKNGTKIQPNVVPAQQITVQPNQIWKAEYEVNVKAVAPPDQYIIDDYDASMLADIGAAINEEDEKNNKAQANFHVASKHPS